MPTRKLGYVKYHSGYNDLMSYVLFLIDQQMPLPMNIEGTEIGVEICFLWFMPNSDGDDATSTTRKKG